MKCQITCIIIWIYKDSSPLYNKLDHQVSSTRNKINSNKTWPNFQSTTPPPQLKLFPPQFSFLSAPILPHLQNLSRISENLISPHKLRARARYFVAISLSRSLSTRSAANTRRAIDVSRLIAAGGGLRTPNLDPRSAVLTRAPRLIGIVRRRESRRAAALSFDTLSANSFEIA